MYDATIVVLRWGGGRVGVPIKRSACAAPVTLTRAQMPPCASIVTILAFHRRVQSYSILPRGAYFVEY
jgi:hypothetical protein